ncbi:MAG: ATP-binding protein [Chloroflexota bacterium]|nr:4Fe-4S dicluster domain-containing protein [Chloroflexota bacterium]MBI5703327.1 4Fe-4S dicluster domain-containing protein [Chloroflexota bacterium]
MNLPAVPNADLCTMCGFCAQACPPHALRWVENPRETRLVLAPADCDGCGKCVQVCEFKAMTLVPAPSPAGSSVGDEGAVILCSSPVVPCRNCGAPIASKAELAYIVRQIGEAKWQNYCLDCRGIA